MAHTRNTKRPHARKAKHRARVGVLGLGAATIGVDLIESLAHTGHSKQDLVAIATARLDAGAVLCRNFARVCSWLAEDWEPAELVRLCIDAKLDLILPGDNAALSSLAQVRSQLLDHGIGVAAPPPAALNIWWNPTLSNLSIAASSADEAVGNDRWLCAAVVGDGGKLFAIACARALRSDPQHHIWAGVTIDCPAAQELATTVCNNLGWTGPICIDFTPAYGRLHVHSARPLLPRFALAPHLLETTNFAALSVAALCGERPAKLHVAAPGIVFSDSTVDVCLPLSSLTEPLSSQPEMV